MIRDYFFKFSGLQNGVYLKGNGFIKVDLYIVLKYSNYFINIRKIVYFDEK